MHEISEQTAQAAKEHAQVSLKHGQSVEKVGKSLQSGDLPDQELGKRIEEYGQIIQKHALQSLTKAHKLTEDASTEVFFRVFTRAYQRLLSPC